jgi:hypothetical protein
MRGRRLKRKWALVGSETEPKTAREEKKSMTKQEARVAARKARAAGKNNTGSFHDPQKGDWYVTDTFKDSLPVRQGALEKVAAKKKK